MQDENTTQNVEGLEILTTKATKLKKDEFFNMLKKEPNGLVLTIDGVGKTFESKWTSENGTKKYGCFIDYKFTNNSNEYEVGLSYNLGVPIDEETYKITSKMNIFKILSVAVDLSKAEEIKVTKQFIDSLTGIKFLGEIDSGHKGFIINPVRRIE